MATVDAGFKYRCDERVRLCGLKEREGWREAERETVQRGEHEEIKEVFQSQSLVGLFESWWLSAGIRINRRM